MDITSKHANGIFWVEAWCVSETDRAIKVIVDHKEYWVPKSQVWDSQVTNNGDIGLLGIRTALATKMGLRAA